MYPETPKPSGKKPAGLTPSFTFGSMGPSPSAFRFVSPRNMNLLNSFSPHQLFNRFCKTADDSSTETKDNSNQTHCDSQTSDEPQQKVALGPSILSPFNGHRSSQTLFHESTVVSATTADSADLWSFTGDANHMPMDLTSITEVADDKETFFSPTEMFLEKSPLERVSEDKNTQPPKTPRSPEKSPSSRKRKLSDIQDSPCTHVASQINVLQSPPRNKIPLDQEDSGNSKKVWTKTLDDELMRCLQKYNSFKEFHGSNEAIFRGTCQNKILSRMLENKTGVFRSQKQISGRILKLLRSGAPVVKVEPTAESTPLKHSCSQPAITTPSMKNTTNTTGAPPSTIACFEIFNMSFSYKDASQPRHVFAHLSKNGSEKHRHCSIHGARRSLPQKNSMFLADYDEIAPQLHTQGVNIHNVFCHLDLCPDFSDSSLPVSPMTNHRQFVSANGSFSSYLTVMLREDLFKTSFVTLKSQITVYKNAGQVLFKSEESINGYREDNRGFRVEVPFLNQFWAGFLTYIISGTSDFSDLENLIISQTICDEEGQERTIYGYFVYRFSPASTGRGKARFEVISLTDDANNEVDELETILASSPPRSSPFKTSPAKYDLRVRTDLANTFPTPGPNTTPAFNSGIFQGNNVNHQLMNMPANQRPSMMMSKSTTNINFEKRPANSVMIHANHSFNSGIRHHSAGQMGSFTPNNVRAVSGDSSFYGSPSGNHPGQFSGHAPGMGHQQQMPMNPMAQIHGQIFPYQHQQQMLPNGQVPIHPNIAAGMPANLAPVPWPIATNFQVPQEINSAPASQLHFFSPDDDDKENRVKKSGPPLKFRTMLHYDPSKGADSDATTENTQSNFHTFAVKSPVVFQSDNA
ncbi:hypothetical protein JCM33374_g1024 [Metschnikowia sp. JCM 33374]|nr:hypothetical protein JCM33374_g1024 [Metschnikowia sp. JCM 33374]